MMSVVDVSIIEKEESIPSPKYFVVLPLVIHLQFLSVVSIVNITNNSERLIEISYTINLIECPASKETVLNTLTRTKAVATFAFETTSFAFRTVPTLSCVT